MDGAVLRGSAVHHAELGDGVAAVGNDLADEDVFIGIQPFLDDRHDILSVDGYVALNRFHNEKPPWISEFCFLCIRKTLISIYRT